jgi:hypothetical protein
MKIDPRQVSARSRRAIKGANKRFVCPEPAEVNADFAPSTTKAPVSCSGDFARLCLAKFDTGRTDDRLRRRATASRLLRLTVLREAKNGETT